jgi:dCTP deaminase
MGFLAQNEIRERIRQQQLLLDLDEFEEKRLHQSSYDLRLGPEIYIVGEAHPKLLKQDQPYASLPPGQFAILTTLEKVSIPNDLMAFISVRSKFKFEGLVNISGFHVDPSFKGCLRFAVQNVGPSDIHLKLGTPLFTIFFAELTSNKIGDTRDKEHDIHFEQNLGGIRLEDVQLLGGSNLTMAGLQRQIERLDTQVKIFITLAASAAIGLILKLIHG